MDFSSFNLLSTLFLNPCKLLACTMSLRKFPRSPTSHTKNNLLTSTMNLAPTNFASKFPYWKRVNNEFSFTFQCMKTWWNSSIISWSFSLPTPGKKELLLFWRKITFCSLSRNRPTKPLIIKIWLQQREGIKVYISDTVLLLLILTSTVGTESLFHISEYWEILNRDQ